MHSCEFMYACEYDFEEYFDYSDSDWRRRGECSPSEDSDDEPMIHHYKKSCRAPKTCFKLVVHATSSNGNTEMDPVCIPLEHYENMKLIDALHWIREYAKDVYNPWHLPGIRISVSILDMFFETHSTNARGRYLRDFLQERYPEYQRLCQIGIPFELSVEARVVRSTEKSRLHYYVSSLEEELLSVGLNNGVYRCMTFLEYIQRSDRQCFESCKFAMKIRECLMERSRRFSDEGKFMTSLWKDLADFLCWKGMSFVGSFVHTGAVELTFKLCGCDDSDYLHLLGNLVLQRRDNVDDACTTCGNKKKIKVFRCKRTRLKKIKEFQIFRRTDLQNQHISQ
jgi:hypothetical protein